MVRAPVGRAFVVSLRLTVALCKRPAGGVLPLAGRFRLWGGVFSLAWCGTRGLFVGGKVVRLCGWCCWFVER